MRPDFVHLSKRSLGGELIYIRCEVVAGYGSQLKRTASIGGNAEYVINGGAALRCTGSVAESRLYKWWNVPPFGTADAGSGISTFQKVQQHRRTER